MIQGVPFHCKVAKVIQTVYPCVLELSIYHGTELVKILQHGIPWPHLIPILCPTPFFLFFFFFEAENCVA